MRAVLNLRICILIILITQSFAWEIRAQLTTPNPKKIILANTSLAREISLEGGVVRTVAIDNRLAGRRLEVWSDEFMVELDDYQFLTTADFQLASHQSERTTGGGDREIFIVRREVGHLELKLVYTLEPDDFIMRKQIFIHSSDYYQPIVRRLEIERMAVKGDSGIAGPEELRETRIQPPTQKEIVLGALGQPIFFDHDNLFLGMEYPAGHNTKRENLIVCAHHPGRRAGFGFWASKPAVLGAAHPGNAEKQFYRYLKSVSVPTPPILIYNSWYDFMKQGMPVEGGIKPRDMLEVEEGYRRHLTEPYGVGMNIFSLEPVFENPRSILLPDPVDFPDGFEPLARKLENHGSKLGMWFPPCGIEFRPDWGFGVDIEWGLRQGLEVSDITEIYVPWIIPRALYAHDAAPYRYPRYYCLSGPKYQHALRETLQYALDVCHVGYFKHDFCLFFCSAPAHGHIPEMVYGTEANVDAMIDVIKFERSIQPDLHLALTSNAWLSPWWLCWANGVYRGYGDNGYEMKNSALRLRDRELSFTDSAFFVDLRRDGFRIPVTSIVDLGLIQGKGFPAGGRRETLDSWADYVVFTIGRGLRQQDFYMHPSMLTPEKWDLLGRTLQWFKVNADMLADCQLIGGDPRFAEPYGYSHWKEGRGILCLRNPSLNPQTLKVPLQGVSGEKMRLFVSYPYKKLLPGLYDPNGEFAQSLESYEVMIVEAWPEKELPQILAKEGIRYNIVQANKDGWVIDVAREPEPADKVRWSRTGPASLSLTLPRPYAKHAQLIFVLEQPLNQKQEPPQVDTLTLQINGRKVIPVSDTNESGWISFTLQLEQEENNIKWNFGPTPRGRIVFDEWRVSLWAYTQIPLPTTRMKVAPVIDVHKRTESVQLPTPLAMVERGFYNLIPSLSDMTNNPTGN